MNRKLKSLFAGWILIATMFGAILAASPAASVLNTEDDNEHSIPSPSSADYAYQWDPIGLGCENSNPGPLCESYVEWWYMKVSEIPAMDTQFATHEPANFVSSIIVVNPWDNPVDPDDRVEPTSGAYVAYVVMVGDLQMTYVEWHDVNAFHSNGTSKTKVWVCPDSDLDCTFANAATTIDSNVVSGDPDLVKFDVHLFIDMDHLFRPSSFYKSGMTDYRDSLYHNTFDSFTYEMHFTRDTRDDAKDFGVNAGNVVSSSGANPYADAVVFTTDSEVNAPLTSTMTYHQGITARTSSYTASNFRAYADKGLGADLPSQWIWGMGKWVDVDLSQSPHVASLKKTTVYIGGGLDPTGNVWKSTVVVRYDNPRSGLMDYIYRTAATDPWGTTNRGEWRTVVCGYEDPAASRYYDQDGSWKISVKWTVIIRPLLDSGNDNHCYLESKDSNGNYQMEGGCNFVSGTKERAMISITTTTGRIVDLAIPAMSIAHRNGNTELDPFHDFEALNATVALSLQYCDGGTWKWEKAPTPKHPGDPTQWREDWPISAAFGGFEWGMFQGRVDDQDLIPLPKITQTTSGNDQTFSYSMRNAGKQPANMVVLDLSHWESLGGVWQWVSKQASAGQNLSDGANINMDANSDYGHPADTTADTFTDSFTRTVSNGNAIGFGNKLGGAFFVRNGLGGQGAQSVWGTANVVLNSCDIWKVTADVTGVVAEDDENNNAWQSGTSPGGIPSCISGVAFNVRATIGAPVAKKTGGSDPMAVTFDDGNSEVTDSVMSGDGQRYDMKFALSEADYLDRDLLGITVPVTFLREDTGHSVSTNFCMPVVYTYDDNSDGGISLWNGDSNEGNGDAVAAQVATGPGGYDASQDSYMERAIDLTEADVASTSLWYWVDVQQGNDYLEVEVSQDDSTWTQLDTISLDSSHQDPGAGTWMPYERDLTPYVGGIAYLRMRFVADASVSGPGVKVDEWTVLQAHRDTSTGDFDDGTFDADEVTVDDGSLALVPTDGLYPSESTYTSFARQFGPDLNMVSLSFAGAVPPQTAVLIQVRSGVTSSELLAASWRGPDGTDESYYAFPGAMSLATSTAPGDTWFQYQVTLVSWDTWNTPVIAEVSWVYSSALTEYG